MTGTQVDEFAARLTEQLRALPREEVHELLVRIGRMEARMRADGQERPIWRGALPQVEILGQEVVIPTDYGDRRGRAIYFGISKVGPEYETSVIVFSEASGTHYEGPGSQVRLATQSDSERIQGDLVMAQRLREAAGVLEARRERKRAPSRPKWAPDPGLVQRMIDAARDSNFVSSVEEVGGCYKITGRNRGRRLYVHKRGLRVDISGFEPSGDGIIQISAEEAKKAHLGKVRGQIDFTDHGVGMRTFDLMLEELG